MWGESRFGGVGFEHCARTTLRICGEVEDAGDFIECIAATERSSVSSSLSVEVESLTRSWCPDCLRVSDTRSSTWLGRAAYVPPKPGGSRTGTSVGPLR